MKRRTLARFAGYPHRATGGLNRLPHEGQAKAVAALVSIITIAPVESLPDVLQLGGRDPRSRIRNCHDNRIVPGADPYHHRPLGGPVPESVVEQVGYGPVQPRGVAVYRRNAIGGQFELDLPAGGAEVVDRFGNTIGAVAVYEPAPHKVTADMLEAITDAGDLAQRELLLSDFGGIQQKLLAKLDASRRQALIDELTRLWNRRGGMMLLEQALEGSRRDATVGVCVIDVDDFKQVNDQYGHAMGDVVLRKLAAAIVDCIRPGDIACRLGGDEFLLLIPDIGPDQLQHITERVRSKVQSLVIGTRAGKVKVTVSVGGTITNLGSATSADDLLHRADEAMYEAKRRKGERHAESLPSLDF